MLSNRRMWTVNSLFLLLTKLLVFTTELHTCLAQGSEKLGNKIWWEMEEKELPAARGVASRSVTPHVS